MSPMLDKIEIRHAYKPGDLGHIIRMHGELYDFGKEFEVYVGQTLSAYYQYQDDQKERFWIAELNGWIVGSICLKRTEDWAQLRYFLLDPRIRGIGLGKKLMNLFLDFMAECGYKKSFLLTEKQLNPAANLYEKVGYQYVSSTTTDFGLEERRYELAVAD